MTIQEFCDTYGYSIKTIKTSFNRTVQAMKNKGYKVTREGAWNTGNYIVEKDETLIPKKEVQLSNRLVGQRFGHLTVIKDSGERLHRSIIWECKCDCGNIHYVTSNNLNGGRTKTCGQSNCKYHTFYEDLTGQKFGKLTPLYPTTMKDGTHMYWMCKCDCGNPNLKEVSSSSLKKGGVQSCGCITKSIGETNIAKILTENNIPFQEQVSFPDLKNKKPLRYDFGIYDKNANSLIRLIEFDGIQHFEEQDYFTHSLTEIKINDKIKNEYAKNKNIPLIRIPYTERDSITLEMIMEDKYIVNE